MATSTAVLFPWSDTYCVHIAIIDTQHKTLVGMINDLHQAMTSGHGKDQLGKILAQLVVYTKNHFLTEQRLLEAHHYAEYDHHKMEHDRLTETVLEFQEKFHKNQIGLTVEVMQFLKDWLVQHIQNSDKKYAPFLNAKGVR